MTSSVSVMRTKYAKSWPRHAHGDAAYVLPLGVALTRTYRSDAHFAQYRSPNGRRLAAEALEQGVGVNLEVIAFDVDCPETHGSSKPAPEQWRHCMRDKMRALSRTHPHPYYYETRGGARIVYRQEEPTLLRTRDDGREWARTYAVALAYLARCFGIHADPACADWQRLYRLPHATREQNEGPENWSVLGDAACIGALTINATQEDVDRAMRASKAFRVPRIANLAPCTQQDGYGLLYHALRARGAVFDRRPDGAFVVRCPRELQHTSGRTGDGSTLLYLPAPGEQVGAIHCLHGHCAGVDVRGWLREFSTDELEAARQAAGITRAA